MDFFRTMVLVAAAAGLIAGLGMTAAQQLTTVPLILKAEMFEQAEAANAEPQHEHADATAAHEHGEGWAPSGGLERTAFTLAANIITGIGFALLLIAVSELAGGIIRLAARGDVGPCGVCRVHAGARSWASAGAPRNAGGRIWASATLVAGNSRSLRLGVRADRLWTVGARDHWRLGASRSPTSSARRSLSAMVRRSRRACTIVSSSPW